MYKLDLGKAEEPEIKLPTFVRSLKKQKNFRKTSTSASLITLKPLTVWITKYCEKFFKIWEFQTTLPASWETYMQVNKQQLELYMEQWTGSKLGKEYMLEMISESPLDCKAIQPVHPKGNQPWIFIGRTDAEAETPILWPPDGNSQLIRKDPDVGKDWRHKEKGTTEDEMVGWHHWLNTQEFEQAPSDGEGQGSLACCTPWGRKELELTEQLNNNEHREAIEGFSVWEWNNENCIWKLSLWLQYKEWIVFQTSLIKNCNKK